ncbi:MAG: AAA family ATPase, partial [Xanthobacteraceae bacterium]
MADPAWHLHETEPLAPRGPREVISQNDRTRVYRVPATDRRESVIYKERLGPDALARVRHETRMLERLAGVDGVLRLAGVATSGNTLALQDLGGVALSETIGADRLQVLDLIDLGCSLILTVAEMHRRGVVHKDINPTNILVCGRGRRPILTDFDLATTFAEDRPAFVHHSEIAGTPAYLAPEQTGRTGRTVDYRADLYALGATFYELATGRPPFPGDDPLQLIHDHLVRVPTPPIEVDSSLPTGLSDVIMRLLEKEPDRRYQSADGLAHDLSHLREMLTRGDRGSFPLAQRDFPLRLSAPSRLSGRTQEIGALHGAFADALDGRGRGILVAGASGTGKTVLIDELRPVVTARRGWFLAGKFDQYGHDAGALVQVLRGMGRMLLAEPEAGLAKERVCILRALGANAGLITAALPEFAALLGNVPDVTSADPIEAEIQLRLTALSLLRAVVSPARPVVIVLDDLQWAYPSSIRFIDAVLTDEDLSGLLLVGAYRESEVDATHPLTPMLAKWQRLGVAPPLLRLANLAPVDLAGLLAGMLRLPTTEAIRLAEGLGARTSGNPFDTVELVNALRRDGVLVATATGWNWDEAAIRRHVGQGDVIDLLSSRIAELPDPTRELLQIMACLGAEVELGLLQAASGLEAAALGDLLAPALEDGLLVMDRRGDRLASQRQDTIRFRHDRVQQAAHDGLDPELRRALHVAVARRLVRASEYRVTAAGQYFSAIEAVHDPDERRRVVALFHEAAGHGRHTANYVAVEQYLAAATKLLDADAVADDDPVRAAIEEEWHTALYTVGRLEEADELYAGIERRCRDPLAIAEAACIQVNSLCNRGQLHEATALGLDLLARLGSRLPSGTDSEVAERLKELYRSISVSDVAKHLRRAEVSDPRVVAVSKLMHHIARPATFCNPPVLTWMVLESVRLLTEHGPCASLMCNLGSACAVTIALGRDYGTGCAIARDALEASEARGYEPESSQLAMVFACFGSHWSAPVENSASLARRAREGLLRSGDLYFASVADKGLLDALVDCAPTLEACGAEADAALAFAERTGNGRTTTQLLIYRQLARSLRGQTSVPGDFSDGSFDADAHMARLAADLPTTVIFRTYLALAAALVGDAAKLAEHSSSAWPLRSWTYGLYHHSSLYLLRALALAEQVRDAVPQQRAPPLAELDVCRDWMADRAADAPDNFRHLACFIDAERAWAVGDHWAAATAFDAAMREADPRQRPWHKALIAEHAGLFHQAQGLQHIGRKLLADARNLYAAWGASAKVGQLERDHG